MKTLQQKGKVLKRLRLVYQTVAIITFFYLLIRAGTEVPVKVFFNLDPLIALSTILSSGTLYKGLIYSIIILAGTVFLGRFFCGWICPVGVLNQLISNFSSIKKKGRRIKANRPAPRQRFKYYLLMTFLVLGLFSSQQIGWLDPFALAVRSFTVSVLPALDYPFGILYPVKHYFHLGWIAGVLFLGIMFMNLLFHRFFCRVMCPLGALLGLFAKYSVCHVIRDEELCDNCRTCAVKCQGACEPDGKLMKSECFVCLNCIENCPENAMSYRFLPPDSGTQVSPNLTRRKIIGSALAGLLLYPVFRTSSGVNRAWDNRLIRPPGSVEEKEFLARCIKCGQCMKACPTNVIQPAAAEAGAEGLWTPVNIYRIGHCEQGCTVCGKVCPTGAIQPMTVAQRKGLPPHKKPIKIGTAAFNRGRCLPWANAIPCIVCEEMCPTSPKAIYFVETTVKDSSGNDVHVKQPYVDPDRCIGCGICERNCPVIDKPAVYVTSIGETRSKVNTLLLKS
jgi:polyferredoxin